MSFSTGYTFGFATVVCVVCSLSVASLSLGLRDIQAANKRRDLQSNILNAVGLPEDGHALKGEEIDALWAERIEFRAFDASGKLIEGAGGDKDGDGDTDADDAALARVAVKGTDQVPDVLGVYVRRSGGRDEAYALPMFGQGLWGPVSGYVALDPHASEVTGVTFFGPKETPGLGAEIEQPKFKSQWIGKKITDSAGKTQTIHVVKGEATTLCPDDLEHCVDGVSGATLTCRGVDEMVSRSLSWYDPYLQQLRSH